MTGDAQQLRRAGVRPRGPRLAVAAALSLGAFLIAGCGILPAAPSPLPSDFVPEPTLAADEGPGALSPDGFTVAQRMAVRVRNIGCGSLSTGSGFILDNHTLITNRHVVEGAKTIQLSTYDGRSITANTASAASIADIAIVTTDDSLGVSGVSRAEADPKEGDVITVVGYPNGGKLTTTTGVVIGTTTDPLGGAVGPVLASTAQIASGSSGSAAFNAAGEVVGVVYAKNDSDQSFLVPISTLNSLLEEQALLQTVPKKCDDTNMMPR